MPAATAHRTAVLAIILVSYLMIVLDISIVITGLPKIQHGLNFSPTGLSWVQASAKAQPSARSPSQASPLSLPRTPGRPPGSSMLPTSSAALSGWASSLSSLRTLVPACPMRGNYLRTALRPLLPPGR
jgi:hypothetical protein